MVTVATWTNLQNFFTVNAQNVLYQHLEKNPLKNKSSSLCNCITQKKKKQIAELLQLFLLWYLNIETKIVNHNKTWQLGM